MTMMRAMIEKRIISISGCGSLCGVTTGSLPFGVVEDSGEWDEKNFISTKQTITNSILQKKIITKLSFGVRLLFMITMFHVQYLSMYYIVALGNPGSQYSLTRHNIGWRAADSLVTKAALDLPRVALRGRGLVTEGVVAGALVTVLYPTTYMNTSGGVVTQVVMKDSQRQMIVLHDDIALPLGRVRVSVGSGAAGHNGVQSIIDACGTKDFIRVRIGVGAPPSDSTLERFVLEPFTSAEELLLPEVLEKVVGAVEVILREGVEVAMNTYNTAVTAST